MSGLAPRTTPVSNQIEWRREIFIQNEDLIIFHNITTTFEKKITNRMLTRLSLLVRKRACQPHIQGP